MRLRTPHTGPLPDLIARFLLGGFDALPNGRLEDLPDGVGSMIFDLYCAHLKGAHALFRKHERYLRECAQLWGIAPVYRDAVGRTFFYAELKTDHCPPLDYYVDDDDEPEPAE